MQASVRICAKCGRGLLGAARGAAKDAQPVWWTQETEGPMCNGRLVWVSAAAQIAFLNNVEERIDP